MMKLFIVTLLVISVNSADVDELKKLYEEELALKAPAQYWEERAKEMRIQGQWWLAGLTLSTIIGVICLFNLLGSIGTGEFEKMFKKMMGNIDE